MRSFDGIFAALYLRARDMRRTDFESSPESPKAAKGKRKASAKNKKASTKEDDSLADAMGSLSVNPDSPSSPSQSQPMEGAEVADEAASLWFWDVENGEFIQQAEEVSAQVIQPKAGVLEFYLSATDENGNRILAHQITSEMMVRWAHQITALTWSHMQNGRMSCWCFRFLSGEAYESFKQQFIVRMWETKHEMPWAKAKVKLPHFALCDRQ